MFRKFVAIILIVCLAAPLFALDMSQAEPYDESEFPKWSLGLRRSEIIFFGAIPIAYPFTSIITDAMDKDLSFGEKLGISAGVAAGVVVLDIIIGLLSRDRE